MFEHMLVPLDGSSLAECALPHTVAVARAFDSRVTLLRVLVQPEDTGQSQFVSPLGWYIGEAEARAYLDEVGERLQKAGLWVEKALLEGQAAERIIEFARDRELDPILLSSHGQSGLSGWNISSVVQKIILRTHGSIMIVRAYRSVTDDLTGVHYRRLLVPLDCSQRAECVLPLATTLARFHGAQLLLAHVVCEPEISRRMPPTQEVLEWANQLTEYNRSVAARYLEELQTRLAPDVQAPSDVQTCLLFSDNATTALHDLVLREDIDMVILSSHSHTGGTKWPYSGTALNFIAYGDTPLMIVQDLSRDEIERTQAEMAIREHRGH